MSNKKIALIAIIAAGILSSAVAGIAKKGLEEIPPYSYTFLRFFVASICILPFFLRSQGHQISKMSELVPKSIFATINVLFFVIGLNLTTANMGSVMYAAVPLLVAVIMYLFFKERLSKDKEIGIGIGFLGVVFITLLPVFEKGNPFAGNLLGNIFISIAIISWSFYMVYSKKLLEKYSPLIITSNFIFVSTIALAPFFLWELQSKFGWWNNVGLWGIFSVLYVGIVISVISYMLNQYAIKHGGAVLASMMFYIMPILGVGINFAILGEILTPGFIFGSVLALLGTYLVVRK